MKCEEVQILIEDYVDSALDQKAAALVKAHMTGCNACSSFHREVTREQELYARYERDVEVTPALWTSIENRIKQERIEPRPGLLRRLREQLSGVFAAPRLSPAFAAALVLIAIGITVGVMTYLHPRDGEKIVATKDDTNRTVQPDESKAVSPSSTKPDSPTGSGDVASTGAPRNQQPAKTEAKTERNAVSKKNLTAKATLTPAQLVRDAEQKYLTAISMLSRDVNRQRAQLDPILLARLDASLSEIDRTIKETRRVVRENPGDPIALQYLLAAYSKKVEVLRGMTTD